MHQIRLEARLLLFGNGDVAAEGKYRILVEYRDLLVLRKMCVGIGEHGKAGGCASAHRAFRGERPGDDKHGLPIDEHGIGAGWWLPPGRILRDVVAPGRPGWLVVIGGAIPLYQARLPRRCADVQRAEEDFSLRVG